MLEDQGVYGGDGAAAVGVGYLRAENENNAFCTKANGSKLSEQRWPVSPVRWRNATALRCSRSKTAFIQSVCREIFPAVAKCSTDTF